MNKIELTTEEYEAVLLRLSELEARVRQLENQNDFEAECRRNAEYYE